VPLAVQAFGVTHRWNPFNWRRRIIQLGRFTDGPAVVNVHLTPHGPTSEADRAAEVAWLLGRLDRTGDTVVGGDFNASPGDSIFARLADEGLRDAWSAVHPDGAGGDTNWHGRRDRPPNRRIDYIWASAGSAVAAAGVPAFGTPGFAVFPLLSDHLPLTATFEVAARLRAG
jgi:endonuclease/exonuclease/phosphatase family metal-dependent hydrolase